MLKKSLLSERNQMQNAMYMLPFIWHSRTLNTIAAENRSVVVISHIWRKDIDWKRQGNFCGDWFVSFAGIYMTVNIYQYLL